MVFRAAFKALTGAIGLAAILASSTAGGWQAPGTPPRSVWDGV